METRDKHSNRRPNSYNLFTPPFSPIPTPLSIPNPPTINCPYLLSHSSTIFQFFSNFKTSNGTKNISIPASTMVESNVESIEENIPTPSNSNTSKESMPASIPVYSHAVIPYPGAPGTFFFEGSNVTNFLDRYSQMCTDYRVDKHEKIKQLL